MDTASEASAACRELSSVVPVCHPVRELRGWLWAVFRACPVYSRFRYSTMEAVVVAATDVARQVESTVAEIVRWQRGHLPAK
jgi:hypothetical protein